MNPGIMGWTYDAYMKGGLQSAPAPEPPKAQNLEEEFPYLSAATIARFREAARTHNPALVGLDPAQREPAHPVRKRVSEAEERVNTMRLVAGVVDDWADQFDLSPQQRRAYAREQLAAEGSE